MLDYADSPSPVSAARCWLGNDPASGRPVSIPWEDLQVHAAVFGRSRTGKSKWLEWLCRQIILSDQSLIVVDPHGPLYHALLAFCSAFSLQDRLVLFDVDDQHYGVPGINPIQPDSNFDVVDATVTAISKAFGQETAIDSMPRLYRWLHMTVQVLSETGFTIADILPFWSLASPTFRYRLLGRIRNTDIQAEMMDFETLRRQEKESYIEAVKNRGANFSEPPVSRILGQPTTTIDVGRIMDEGQVLLVNLGSQSLDMKTRRLLGTLLLDRIVAATHRREPDVSRQVYLVLDEFQNFCRDDTIAYEMDAAGKYRVSWICATQRLQALEREGPNIKSSLLTNAHLKATFGVSAQDAREIADEYWHAPHDVINEAAAGTKVHLKKTRDLVFVRGTTSSSGSSSGAVSSAGFGHGHTIPDMGLVADGSTTWSQHSGSATSHGSFDGSGVSESVADVPSVDFEEYKESTTVISPQQWNELYKSWLASQPNRLYQLKINPDVPVQLRTPDVLEPATVGPRDIDQVKRRVYAIHGPCKPYEVDYERAERIRVLSIPTVVEDDIEDSQPHDRAAAVKAKAQARDKQARAAVLEKLMGRGASHSSAAKWFRALSAEAIERVLTDNPGGDWPTLRQHLKDVRPSS